jgi:hypothetical protein
LLLNAPGAGRAGRGAVDGTPPAPGGWNRFQLLVEDLGAYITNWAPIPKVELGQEMADMGLTVP